MPDDVLPLRRILRIAGAGKIQAGEVVEVLLAVLAVTHAGSCPSIGEDAIHHVLRHDFLMDRGHEFKVVGSQRAGEPEVRIRRVLALLAVLIHREPVRMRVVNILMASVRVGAGNDIHAQFPAAMGYIAEGIHIPQPLAAVVQGNLRGVKSDATAGIQNCGVGMDPLEIVQPELHVVIAGIVFDKA